MKGIRAGRTGGGGCWGEMKWMGKQTDHIPLVEKTLPHDNIFLNSLLRKIVCPGLETLWV